MSKQLAEKQESNIIPAADGMLAVIERAATDPNVDVEKMERLYKMYSDMQERKARQEFSAAMADAQADMRPIAADASNPQTKSRYASYNALDRALRPIYSKHGFAISFDTDDSPKPDHVRVLAYVAHRGGHTQTYKQDMPSDGKGAKGGDVMTKTHASGAAMSYGMRYLLKGIFNVAVGEDDRDGNAARGPAVSEEQIANLIALSDEVGADLGKFLKFLKVEKLEDLPASRYESAVKALEKKRGKS